MEQCEMVFLNNLSNSKIFTVSSNLLSKNYLSIYSLFISFVSKNLREIYSKSICRDLKYHSSLMKIMEEELKIHLSNNFKYVKMYILNFTDKLSLGFEIYNNCIYRDIQNDFSLYKDYIIEFTSNNWKYLNQLNSYCIKLESGCYIIINLDICNLTQYEIEYKNGYNDSKLGKTCEEILLNSYKDGVKSYLFSKLISGIFLQKESDNSIDIERVKFNDENQNEYRNGYNDGYEISSRSDISNEEREKIMEEIQNKSEIYINGYCDGFNKGREFYLLEYSEGRIEGSRDACNNNYEENLFYSTIYQKGYKYGFSEFRRGCDDAINEIKNYVEIMNYEDNSDEYIDGYNFGKEEYVDGYYFGSKNESKNLSFDTDVFKLGYFDGLNKNCDSNYLSGYNDGVEDALSFVDRKLRYSNEIYIYGYDVGYDSIINC